MEFHPCIQEPKPLCDSALSGYQIPLCSLCILLVIGKTESLEETSDVFMDPAWRWGAYMLLGPAQTHYHPDYKAGQCSTEVWSAGREQCGFDDYIAASVMLNLSSKD